jgi:hypothetical protein
LPFDVVTFAPAFLLEPDFFNVKYPAVASKSFLLFPGLSPTMFHATMAVKTYVVTVRRHKDRRPSKFIVMADSMRRGADFQGRSAS